MNEALSRRIERKQRRRAASRNAIVEAARLVAAREGAGALSLRAVAAEAGYAPASVYAYFRNRGELVLALAGEDLGALARSLREGGSPGGKGNWSAAARAALSFLEGKSTLADAVAALESGEAPPEAERLFNGRLIAALTAFADAAGLPSVKSREQQADVVLAAAAIAGLAVLARAGRLKALGFEEGDLLARLEKRFSDGLGPL
jgi:AcrR family transcriptional regulator